MSDTSAKSVTLVQAVVVNLASSPSTTSSGSLFQVSPHSVCAHPTRFSDLLNAHSLGLHLSHPFDRAEGHRRVALAPVSGEGVCDFSQHPGEFPGHRLDCGMDG